MTYVIIGNGFAGIRAIENIREIDQEGEIIVISDEENYSRPLISYYLGKKVEASAMPFRSAEFFKKNNVTLKIGKKAVKVDTKGKSVEIEGGEKVAYDKLLLATGGKPFIPPIAGSDAQGVFNFTTLADANNIKDYIAKNKVTNAVVLGGGLIGLKATEALMALEVSVTVVELADRVLSATFDKKASRIIENALRKSNCEVLTEDTIEKIVATDGKVSGVDLKSKMTVEAQMVIVAIGVRANIDLANDTPIKTNRGIVVNDFMETSVKDVFAAGDAAESEGWVIAILPIAAKHGKVAGHNMAVKNKMDYTQHTGGIPMNAVGLAGVPTISVGLTDPKENVKDYEILEKYKPKENLYKKLILKDNVLVGTIFVGDINRAGIFTGMILEKLDVTPFKDQLMKDSFGLISLPKNYRKHKVSGEAYTL